MDRLGLDYLDLYLVHWPQPALNKFVDTFKASPTYLTVFIDATGMVPAVNRIELHPRLPRTEPREVHAQRGIATEAWAPLGKGSLLTHPTVTAVAETRGRTPAQVLIR